METFLLADIILAATAVAWLFTAAVQDLKKREVANWLSFSLIIIALAIRAIASIVSFQPVNIENVKNIFLQIGGLLILPFNFTIKSAMLQIIFMIKQINFILLSSHLYYFIYGLGFVVLFFIIANLFYYTRKIGRAHV